MNEGEEISAALVVPCGRTKLPSLLPTNALVASVMSQ